VAAERSLTNGVELVDVRGSLGGPGDFRSTSVAFLEAAFARGFPFNVVQVVSVPSINNPECRGAQA